MPVDPEPPLVEVVEVPLVLVEIVVEVDPLSSVLVSLQTEERSLCSSFSAWATACWTTQFQKLFEANEEPEPVEDPDAGAALPELLDATFTLAFEPVLGVLLVVEAALPAEAGPELGASTVRSRCSRPRALPPG
ncbi:MAG TPA: hypothetical protein VHX88_11345, partial [Solirubrobacteraceae bacterium]|nr:hypothetical protein [Solirubrobacteraceae bacterium]